MSGTRSLIWKGKKKNCIGDNSTIWCVQNRAVVIFVTVSEFLDNINKYIFVQPLLHYLLRTS